MANAVQDTTCGYEWQEPIGRQAPISVKYKGHDVGKDRLGRRMLLRPLVMSKHPPFSPPLGVLGALAVQFLVFFASWRFHPWRPWRLGGSNLGVFGVLAVPSCCNPSMGGHEADEYGEDTEEEIDPEKLKGESEDLQRYADLAARTQNGICKG